jgi:tripartite-type tricarboxylate transporter receptor subunit TctC
MRTLANAALSFGLAATFVTAVHAQGGFPNKPVKVILPYSAGGVIDLAYRIVGKELESRWGQPLITEARPGAGGRVAFESAARAVPDGYTYVNVVSALTTMPYLYKDLTFSPQRDLVGVTGIMRFVTHIGITSAVPANNLDELVAYAKANPGKLNYATQGRGNYNHLVFEIFNAGFGIQTVGVHFPGTEPAVLAALRNDVQMFLVNDRDLARAQGKFRFIATLGDKRDPKHPEAPSLKETGRFEFLPLPWIAMAAPAGVPKNLIEKVSADFVSVLKRPEIAAEVLKTTLADSIMYMTPADVDELLRSEFKRWGELIPRMGIAAQ